MQEDEELTLEDVEDKIEKLESDINDRLDAQEEVLKSFNEALERIEDYLMKHLTTLLLSLPVSGGLWTDDD